MKYNNIKIAIVELGHFYNTLVEKQIYDLCSTKNYNKLSWIIKSYENAEMFRKDSKRSFHVMIVDNHSDRINRSAAAGDASLIEKFKQKNKDCMFILVSGNGELRITAEIYSQGELCFYYLKQNNMWTENAENGFLVPTLYKLVDKMLSCFQEKMMEILNRKHESRKFSKYA